VCHSVFVCLCACVLVCACERQMGNERVRETIGVS